MLEPRQYVGARRHYGPRHRLAGQWPCLSWSYLSGRRCGSGCRRTRLLRHRALRNYWRAWRAGGCSRSPQNRSRHRLPRTGRNRSSRTARQHLPRTRRNRHPRWRCGRSRGRRGRGRGCRWTRLRRGGWTGWSSGFCGWRGSSRTRRRQRHRRRRHANRRLNRAMASAKQRWTQRRRLRARGLRFVRRFGFGCGRTRLCSFRGRGGPLSVRGLLRRGSRRRPIGLGSRSLHSGLVVALVIERIRPRTGHSEVPANQLGVILVQ